MSLIDLTAGMLMTPLKDVAEAANYNLKNIQLKNVQLWTTFLEENLAEWYRRGKQTGRFHAGLLNLLDDRSDR